MILEVFFGVFGASNTPLIIFDAPNTPLIICSFIFLVQANPILILVLQIDKFLMGFFFLYFNIYF